MNDYEEVSFNSEEIAFLALVLGRMSQHSIDAMIEDGRWPFPPTPHRDDRKKFEKLDGIHKVLFDWFSIKSGGRSEARKTLGVNYG